MLGADGDGRRGLVFTWDAVGGCWQLRQGMVLPRGTLLLVEMVAEQTEGSFQARCPPPHCPLPTAPPPLRPTAPLPTCPPAHCPTAPLPAARCPLLAMASSSRLVCAGVRARHRRSVPRGAGRAQARLRRAPPPRRPPAAGARGGPRVPQAAGARRRAPAAGAHPARAALASAPDPIPHPKPGTDPNLALALTLTLTQGLVPDTKPTPDPHP